MEASVLLLAPCEYASVICLAFLVQEFGTLMQSLGVALSAAIAHTVYTFWNRRETCVCQCSSGAVADERILTILKEQLERCGPEHLSRVHPVSLLICLAVLFFSLGCLTRELVRLLRARRPASPVQEAEPPVVPERALAVTPSRRRT